MLDPNIFSRYKTKADFDREAQEFEYRKRQQALQEQLGQVQLAQAQKQLAQPEQLGMEQLIAKSIQLGGNLSPQEQAQLQAYDIAQRTKQSVDPRGNIVTNRSLFDLLPNQVNQMPTRQVMNMPVAATPTYAPQPMPAMPQDVDSQLNQLGQIDPSQFGITSPYAQEDVRKMAAEEAIKAQGRQIKSKEESEQLRAENLQSLSILNRMKDLNEGTLDIPYAGAAQFGTRLVNQEAASNMARLRQLRLNLAAPLAKQLGVNPTDKDFENTLNQIFNENESKETRREQIELLIDITEGKVNPEGVSGLNSMLQGVSLGLPKESVSKPTNNDPLGLFK